MEYVLAALAACLTSGLANIAAARGVELTSVESTVEGDIDLLGLLGLSDARPPSRFRGFAGQPGYLRQASGPGWALVGDAGAFEDPLSTGSLTRSATPSGSRAQCATFAAARRAKPLHWPATR